MSTADTVPPPTERSTRILEAACRVIVREGAHGLRMASVAEEAGVSKALVHYYFSTRQELLRNAFAFSEQRWQAASTPSSRRHDRRREGRADAARQRRPGAAFSEQRALWNEVWSSLRSDDELRPLVERSYRAWLARVVELIEEGQADGSVPRRSMRRPAGWRLAAAADGLDSLLYLGLLDRERCARADARQARAASSATA